MSLVCLLVGVFFFLIGFLFIFIFRLPLTFPRATARRTEAEAAAAAKEALDARVAELEAESKAQMSELNVLLKDKTALQDRYSAAQDELRAQERKVRGAIGENKEGGGVGVLGVFWVWVGVKWLGS